MTDEDESGLPRATGAFARHFTDPLYEDEGDDLAPFGSDEGWELLDEWAGRRDELDAHSRLSTVLECEPGEVSTYEGPMVGVDGIQTAGFITSAAFVLLRLTGQLDDADRTLAVEALDFQIGILPTINPAVTGTPAVLQTQRDDLAAWRNPG